MDILSDSPVNSYHSHLLHGKQNPPPKSLPKIHIAISYFPFYNGYFQMVSNILGKNVHFLAGMLQKIK